MFRRKIYNQILMWKNNSQGKTALLIEGTRRVGKSTIVEEFAKNEYESYIIIDFANADKEIKDLFIDVVDLNYFFLRLQLIYKVDLIKRKSLIIFDGIQYCPLARQAIKLLVKDHRYDYIEVGSCINLVKDTSKILIPSEEQSLQMYPMDYEEFKWALGDTTTSKLLREAYSSKTSLSDVVNRKMMRDFKLYMLVGGMPQAVSEFIETNNFKKVDIVKRNILSIYFDDFNRIDSTGRLAKLFNAIPVELNKKSSRYHVSSVLKNARSGIILKLLNELEKSKTILLAHQLLKPNMGMTGPIDIKMFKMFLCDTGLLVTLMFIDKDFKDNHIYETLLGDKHNTDLDYLYKNAVAQTLVASGYKLYYHVWQNTSTRHNYEIDFLIPEGEKIVPIEVNSSGYAIHKALDEFSKKYSNNISNKYVIYTKDCGKHNDIFYIPIYMACNL